MASKADIEKPISLVRPANAKMVQAILNRAHKQEKSADKALARNMNAALRPVRSKGLLSKALGQAMAHHGRTKKGATSLRPKAPDTNGRAFHFSHSTVGKGPSGGRKGATPGGSGGTGPAASGSGSTTPDSGGGKAAPGSPGFPDLGSREAGHQRYVERDAALARDAVEVFGIPVGQDRDRDAGHAGREQEEGWERDPAAERRQTAEKKAKPLEVDIEALKKDIEQASRGQRTQSAKAAQEYIEDPSKVAPQTRHGHSNSFGTIGETFEERVSFWNDVIEHEREKDARTQIRLVLELPHEASPAVRQEIVKRFCQQYEELGVPYWASIHAPTKKNDHRNHHAHIVHGIRPTKRIIDPSTGKMAWDFTIVEKYKTETRHTRKRHPFRQNAVAAFWDRDYVRDTRKKSPFRQNAVAAFWDRDYVRDTRKKFAEVTNEVLTAHGYDIRYDPRSYKDMGLDIKPMKHVSRVISDKAKVRDFVVLDAAWTRRLIDQEMNAAAVERDKTYVDLKAVEKRLSGLANDIRKLKDVNAKLPAKMKLSPMSRLSVTAAKQLSQKMLEVEHAKISQRFADEATARTIQHIIDSTAPVSAHRGGKARHVKPMPDGPAAPNAEALKVLHASAKEEMRLHRIATAGRARKLGYMAMGVLNQWQEQAQPKGSTSDAPLPQRAKSKATAARKPTPQAPPAPVATPARPMARQTVQTPDFRAAEAMARQGRPAPPRSPAPNPAFLAAEALARQRGAPPYGKVHLTPARNSLEIIERMSMTGQKFPQKMHDYINGQIAGINTAVMMAKAAGPEGMTALWESIKQKIANGSVRATTPAPETRLPEQAAVPPAQARPEPPPVIYMRPPPPAERTQAPPTTPAPAARTEPEAPPARRDQTVEPRPAPTPAAEQRTAQRDAPLNTTVAPDASPRQPASADQRSAPASMESTPVAPTTPAAPARPNTTTAPTPAQPATQPPAAQQTQPTAPPVQLEDMDLEALMRGRYTDKVPEKPKPTKMLKPSDFQRERKPLTKEGNRPISQAELGRAPPRPYDPDAPRGPKPAKVTEQAAAPPEPDVTPEEAVKAKRKKARKRMFIVQRPGIER